MKYFQVSIKGQQPNGGLFQSRAAAQREIGFLEREDRRDAAYVLEQSGNIIPPTEYEIHEVY